MDIDDLFHMLSWNSSEEMQKKGRAIAQQIKYISIFIQPVEDKSVWENCAEILASKNDEELKPYMFELLKWLQDMNWPGAFTVMKRLQNCDMPLLAKPFSQCVDCAWKLGDETWIHNLAGLLSVPELKQILPVEYRTELEDAYIQYWTLGGL